MPPLEQHCSGSDTIRDMLIRIPDGLTVSFAPAARVTGALTASHIVVTAGAACVIAQSIA
jgi:hypothetical protein